jgi:hypothetical protein
MLSCLFFSLNTMKLFSIVAAFMSVALASAAAASSDNNPAASSLIESVNCYWSGTAPFCAGSCGGGTVECNTSACGDGACCITGYKKYCCYGTTCPAA